MNHLRTTLLVVLFAMLAFALVGCQAKDPASAPNTDVQPIVTENDGNGDDLEEPEDAPRGDPIIDKRDPRCWSEYKYWRLLPEPMATTVTLSNGVELYTGEFVYAVFPDSPEDGYLKVNDNLFLVDVAGEQLPPVGEYTGDVFSLPHTPDVATAVTMTQWHAFKPNYSFLVAWTLVTKP